MARIFISYRRGDSAGHAGHLYSTLTQRFGRDAVVMDINSLTPGDNFAEFIRSSVTSSDVLLALIG